jgi:hypothetical protein
MHVHAYVCNYVLVCVRMYTYKHIQNIHTYILDRIVEKTQRCYRGDASQLTDLCRAAIGFESLEVLN